MSGHYPSVPGSDELYGDKCGVAARPRHPRSPLCHLAETIHQDFGGTSCSAIQACLKSDRMTKSRGSVSPWTLSGSFTIFLCKEKENRNGGCNLTYKLIFGIVFERVLWICSS